MEIYGGQCHCRAIRFEVRSELKDLVRCNCSLCIRRSAVMHYVDPADFRLLGGEDHLMTYRFGTRTTAHHFCKTCGVFPFFWSNWGGKEHYAINVACLDGVDPYEQTTRLIDGKSF